MSINPNLDFFNCWQLFTYLINVIKQKLKTRNYTKLVSGIDYIFEWIDEGQAAYMTGSGAGVKPGNYIIWEANNQSYCYQVEEIDYYFDPSDMWIARLKSSSSAD